MKNIIIIKLGAKGDVVRTLCILPAIKKKYPESSIYWITKDNISDLLEGNLHIREILTVPYSTDKKFDILYNFDIEEEATKLAMKIKADKKYGFYSEDNYPKAFNLSSEYYLNTIFDDELKRSNKKTYQEMMFETAELPYNTEKSEIHLNDEDKEYAKNFLNRSEINKKKLIGIHMGTGPRWPSKMWHPDKIKEFIIAAKKENYEILLLGGPDEIGKHEALTNELKKEGITIYTNNIKNTNREFASLIDKCEYIVCSDSFAIHVAIALKKKTIGLFFCTSPDEVEGYGLLTKIVSPMLYDFFPEKMDKYDERLVNSISVEQVLQALKENK